MTQPAKRSPRFFAKVDGGNAHLLVYDEIGQSMFSDGVSAKAVAEQLTEMADAGARDLHIYINSPGGDVFEGNAIVNVVSRWAGKKIVHIDGLAASMASVLAMVGDEIEIAANGMVMVHDPWGVAVGNAEHMIERAALLEQLGESIAGVYEKRTKQKREDVEKWMSDETWMNAETAVERGFADRVVADDSAEVEEDDDEMMAARWPMLAKFRNVPMNATRLLARCSANRNKPAASAAQPPPPAALTEEKQMPEKIDAVAAPAQTVTLSKEQFDELLKARTTVTAPVAATAVASIVDDAVSAPKAPALMKFNLPRALKGREEMSDASAPNDKIRRALPLARIACATVVANDRHMPLADAAASIGFDKTAEIIARNAAMSVSDADAGGSLAHTAQMGFIDALLDMPGITNLIPAGNIIRSDKPSIQLDVLTSGVSGGWVQENPSTGNPEALGTGSKVLTAKKQRIEVLISRDLLRSVSNVDQMVLNKMLLRAKQLDDLAFVEGLGSTNQPKGLEVINANGAAQSGTDYESAYSDLVDVLKRMSADKVPDIAGRAWVAPDQVKWGLAKMLLPGGNVFGFRDEVMANRLMGSPAAFSTLIGTDKVYCFAPGEVLWFEQLAMLLENDNTYINAGGTTVSASGSDQTVIRLWRKIDCDLAHDNSMGLVNTVTWGA